MQIKPNSFLVCNFLSDIMLSLIQMISKESLDYSQEVNMISSIVSKILQTSNFILSNKDKEYLIKMRNINLKTFNEISKSKFFKNLLKIFNELTSRSCLLKNKYNFSICNQILFGMEYYFDNSENNISEMFQILNNSFELFNDSPFLQFVLKKINFKNNFAKYLIQLLKDNCDSPLQSMVNFLVQLTQFVLYNKQEDKLYE